MTAKLSILALSAFALLGAYAWVQKDRADSLSEKNAALHRSIEVLRKVRDIENETSDLDDAALVECLSRGGC